MSQKMESPDRYVFLERPRCPGCGSTSLRTTRSTREGDSVARRTVCRVCGKKFIIVLE